MVIMVARQWIYKKRFSGKKTTEFYKLNTLYYIPIDLYLLHTLTTTHSGFRNFKKNYYQIARGTQHNKIRSTNYLEQQKRTIQSTITVFQEIYHLCVNYIILWPIKFRHLGFWVVV